MAIRKLGTFLPVFNLGKPQTWQVVTFSERTQRLVVMHEGSKADCERARTEFQQIFAGSKMYVQRGEATV